MSGGLAQMRLAHERKGWRKDHPEDFVAKPATLSDGSTDLMLWSCVVPGKAGTIWEAGHYSVKLKFSNDFPSRPPECYFSPPIFHPNVYDDGKICLSIINPPEQGGAWKPCLTIKQILLGIQELLDNLNNDSAAQQAAYVAYRSNMPAYIRRVKEQASRFAPHNL
jgi:ubiquitin-conjugating enzyme E2 I